MVDFASTAATPSHLILSGLYKKPTKEEMAFKSYGNAPSGKPVIMRVPVTAFTGGSKPTVFPAAGGWTKTFDALDYMTAHAARPVNSAGDVVALLWGEEAFAAGLVLLDSTGKIKFGPTSFGVVHGEGTDVVVTTAVGGGDAAFAITGHGDGGVAGELSGRLTKVSLTGARLWSKSFSSCGAPNACGTKFIKTECWGLQPLDDGGVVLACGTGIENCEGMTGAMKTDCKANKALKGDTRAGAYDRAASVWQSMAVRTDADGGVVWQRVDQLRAAGEPALGAAGWAAESSASEYVLRRPSDGAMVFVNDEAIGIGILKLAVEAGGPSPCVAGTSFSASGSGYAPCTTCAEASTCGAAGVKTACTQTTNTVCEPSAGPAFDHSIPWTKGFSGKAEDQTMAVNNGDVLKFVWAGNHNVYQMKDKATFDACDFAGATNLGAASPVYTTMGAATTYFACKVGSHCSNGQKLSAVIAGGTGGGTASSPSPAPAPATSGSTPSPASAPTAPSPTGGSGGVSPSTPSPASGAGAGTGTGGTTDPSTDSNNNNGNGNAAGGGNGTAVAPGSLMPGFLWNGLTIEILVAIGAGGLVAIALACLIGICCCYKRQRRRQSQRDSKRLEMGGWGKSGGGGGSRPKSMAPSYPRPTSIARTAATGGMPSGWEAAIDESSGETYYYHGETGETQWEFPMAPRNARQ